MANKPTTVPSVTAKPTAAKKKFNKTYVLQGKASYFRYLTPNEDGKYTLDLELDAAGLKLAAELNIPIKSPKKEGDTRGSFISFVSYSKDYDGNFIPFAEKVVGPDTKKFEGGPIGNGSIVKVQFYAKDWEKSGKTGTTARMTAVQVLEHVKWTPPSPFEVESEYIDAADESSPFTAKKAG